MNKIGTAVLGIGIYGEVHVRTYKKDSRTELISVWSRTEKHAKEISEKYGCEYATNLDEIASDDRIKIVSIATPDFAHTEPAIKMLEAGKHVLLEKPMAMSVSECDRIIEAQKKGRGKLMVNFHNRWYPPIKEAKKRIDRDEIGEPVSIYARLSDRIDVATHWLSWAEKSGPHWFLFPHTVDLILWFLGEKKPKAIFAKGKKGLLFSKGIDCYDVVQAQLEFKKCLVSIESSWIVPRGWRNIIDFRMDILGTKGKIEIEGDKECISITADSYQTPFVLDSVTEDEPIRYFIDCVESGTNPIPSGEEGKVVTEIIERIEKFL
ncbi:MAG: Gfo/Idh/MocA family oxidoreductase [bacterium]